jgi:predicted Fe-Mo cluster-binding NifX family protein
MKLAISTASPQPDARLDSRFGRCAYFVIIDTETREWDAHPNPAANAGGGAGTQSAQFIANQGVGAVVGPRFGPNAFTVLDAAGIQMYAASRGTVEELVDDYLAGQLKPVTEAAQSGHHGGRRHR